MHPLYPAIKPYQCHELPVGKLHKLYVEETGNPEGMPVIVLHSGPGAGGNTDLRRFFDPQIWRIINFDQRGSGRSLPFIEIRENNTNLLLEDIESIRDYFGLKKITLFGGGWGALLALLYAEQYPHYVCNLLLYRIFLGRKKDIDWIYQHGANLFYPDYWQEFISIVPKEMHDHITKYYERCLQGDNELVRMSAAKHWGLWQARCRSLQSHLDVIDDHQDPHFSLSLATIESHYINNHFFIADNQALANVHKIQHVPSYLIHGRYDIVCPLAGAWELHQSLPASNLSIVRDAGHSLHEAGIIDAVITASLEISRQGMDAC
jgi:proline iminopeptidase